MELKAATGCAQCQRLEAQLEIQRALIEAQQAQLECQRAQLECLQATVAQLQQQLAAAKKNSSTSSKPPSSDIVKPPKPANSEQTRRSPGGQPGHPKHERALFPPELVDKSFDHPPDSCCPDCGQVLRPTGFPPRIIQQVDVLEVPLYIEEHRCHEAYCPHCDKTHYGCLPLHIQRGGLLGPRLTVLVAYLKGVCHASYSTVRKFLRDVVGLTFSRGQLAKVIAKVSQAMEQAWQELLEALPGQAILNVDETGHKDGGARMWTWCFRASLFTLFKIDATRSGDVLIEVLGEEFKGVLGCDFFSAYRRYMREFDIRLQFCLAHLIREVKYLTTLPDGPTKAYGERFREALRRLFGVIHQREQLSQGTFLRQLEAARAELMRVATENVPATRGAANLAARMEKYGESYFRFITTPGMEATNNSAEQAIRFVVIDRHITQGTHGEKGQRWCERIWTVIATCAQQGRSVWEYLQATMQAYFTGEKGPTLLPASK
jgi:transposase